LFLNTFRELFCAASIEDQELKALVGLAIGFALPTFAQQTNTPDPKLREALARLSLLELLAVRQGS
jgi:hypothetical protein